MENSMEVPQKLQNRSTLAITLLGINPKEIKLACQRECTPIFIVSLFTVFL
jgi:hypothetical protein